jgi:plastocyanin
MRFAASLPTVAAVLGLAACGGGGGGNGAATCSPGPTASMNITAAGVSPTNVCVSLGGKVTFTNSDNLPHHIEFDTAGCPTVPEITAGSQQQATFPSSTVNCSFHDGNNSAAAFTGTVAVTAVVVSGGGY